MTLHADLHACSARLWMWELDEGVGSLPTWAAASAEPERRRWSGIQIGVSAVGVGGGGGASATARVFRFSISGLANVRLQLLKCSRACACTLVAAASASPCSFGRSTRAPVEGVAGSLQQECRPGGGGASTCRYIPPHDSRAAERSGIEIAGRQGS
eukprot:355616-Chlamydomonas_euryale.AAC.4